MDLAAARAALARPARRGVVPAPRPSDAELLGSLGIDAHVGLSERYQGAMALLVADLAVELGGVQR
jgi:hypothetical protein